MASIEGNVALVTGGGRGIGKHLARALLAAGAKVHITGRDRATLDAACQDLGGGCQGWQCDHSRPVSIDALARDFLDRVEAPDILVHNAGCMRSRPVTQLSLEEWNQVLDTNLTGVFWTTRVFLPGMIAKKRGDIFLISSMSGKKGDPGAAAYAASKFGLQGFGQSLAHEVRRDNIRVMILNPSSVDKSETPGSEHGSGLHLHAIDLASLVVHLAELPGRTLVRDMDIWGTNPF